MDKQELIGNLAQFTGTEAYYRYSRLFPKVLLTDGVRWLADAVGAYWLLDVIASHLPAVPADEHFVLAVLNTHKEKAKFVLCSDMDDGEPIDVHATQHIEYTDFPLPDFKMYVSRSEHGWVVMLASEY